VVICSIFLKHGLRHEIFKVLVTLTFKIGTFSFSIRQFHPAEFLCDLLTVLVRKYLLFNWTENTIVTFFKLVTLCLKYGLSTISPLHGCRCVTYTQTQERVPEVSV